MENQWQILVIKFHYFIATILMLLLFLALDVLVIAVILLLWKIQKCIEILVSNCIEIPCKWHTYLKWASSHTAKCGELAHRRRRRATMLMCHLNVSNNPFHRYPLFKDCLVCVNECACQKPERDREQREKREQKRQSIAWTGQKDRKSQSTATEGQSENTKISKRMTFWPIFRECTRTIKLQ